ncbi:MAG TPA: c-type cytochrome [Gemmatimonadota bacterium]|nr:c-type cytochrome [Gemmatimonadota bacterium]
MRRPRLPNEIGVCAFLCGLFALPPQVLAQTLPPLDSLPPGVTMEMVEQGRTLFNGDALCADCHGADAVGDIGPDLSDGEWLQEKGSYLSIVEVILDGVPEARSTTGTAMPPRGDTEIDDLDVQSVAAYVWKMSHPEAGDSLPEAVTTGMVQRGEQVFLGEGGCALCHGTEATGLLGPDLTDDEWLDAKGSYLTIGRIIARGVPLAESTRGVEMPPRGGSDISAADLEHVAAYVWYISHRK